jgi:hypothetical protein
VLKTTKGAPDERKHFSISLTLFPLTLFSISSNQAQNGNLSLDFDLKMEFSVAKFSIWKRHIEYFR